MGLTMSAGEVGGHAITHCGCPAVAGFERSASMVINFANIEPWDAGALVKARLDKQQLLAKDTPLRQIPVDMGLSWFSDKLGGRIGRGLTPINYLKVTKELLQTRNVPFGSDQHLLDLFESIDYDGNEHLSVGEWASGLGMFFKGSQREKDLAVFKLLDRDSNGILDRAEFDEYLRPLVQAMTPPDAAALRPLLMKHVGDVIFAEVDLDDDHTLSAEEFAKWRSEKNLVDELKHLIESQVYKIWVDHHLKSPSSFH